jgi:hypothetical protein
MITPTRHFPIVFVPCPDHGSGAFAGTAICGQDADNLPYQQGQRRQLQDDAFTTAAFRAGIVIAATPNTTQPRPIHTVGDSVSPRKITPSATPIGTRK